MLMDPRMRKREIANVEEDAFRRGPSDSPLASSVDTPMSGVLQQQTFIATQQAVVVETVHETRAQARAMSAGPAVRSVNPFWSQRAREEVALQTARPEGLPHQLEDREALQNKNSSATSSA